MSCHTAPTTHLSASRARLGLIAPLAFRPRALDVGEHGPDLGVAEDIGKPGHVALVSAPTMAAVPSLTIRNRMSSG